MGSCCSEEEKLEYNYNIKAANVENETYPTSQAQSSISVPISQKSLIGPQLPGENIAQKV